MIHPDLRVTPSSVGEPLAWESSSEDATRSLGELLGTLLRAGDLLALRGDLGVGKTVFTQGLAWGLGVDRGAYVNSPSFTYVREHQGRVPLYHLDLYRIGDPDELDLIGLRDFLGGGGVCSVEWPDQVPGWLPESGLWLDIEEIPAGRRLRLRGLDERGREILEALRRQV